MATRGTVRQVKQGERLRRSQHTAHSLPTPAEVEGYGPYKPVPPPKPLSTSTPTSGGQGPNTSPLIFSGSGVGPLTPAAFTPPPYRLPPHRPGSLYDYGEPTMPGAAPLDTPVSHHHGAFVNPNGLHTHSNKFPIEREVILSNGDKNSKIPILNEYKKRTKAAIIAPDVPPKQLAAWTMQGNGVDLSQNYSTSQPHSAQQPQASNGDNMQYRSAQYHQDMIYSYNDQQSTPGPSTGAVPKSSWHRQSEPAFTPHENGHRNTHTVAVTIESNPPQKEAKNTKGMTKTYQTIRGIISSKFKTGKEELEKDIGLNNVTDELRKSTRSIDCVKEDGGEERQITSILKKPPAGEQGIYGKPRTEQTQREGLNLQHQQQQLQHLQQQKIHQEQILQQQQQKIQQEQLQQQKIQQEQLQQQKIQQEQLQQQILMHQHQMQMQYQQNSSQYHGSGYPSGSNRNQEQMYYHNSASALPAQVQQRPFNRYGMQQTPPDPSFMPRQYGDGKSYQDDDKREPRSQQQLERDNIRQRSLTEARRAASQPQLAGDDNEKSRNGTTAQITDPIPVRRGSHGNIMESYNGREDKDSDDGGFIKRNDKKNTDLKNDEKIESKPDQQKTETAVGLAGTPRAKLEGEIGKIEGVYNIGKQNDRIELTSTELGEKAVDVPQRKLNAGSSTSSDYDKAGQSSSNVDSGRGSAAYSSGRRQTHDDTSPDSSDNHPLQGINYVPNNNNSGRDSEWVDIVDSELRHILEPKLHGLSLQSNNPPLVANSTVSESISSMTPPLPPLSPGDGSTPNVTPRNSTRYRHGQSLPYGSKPDYGLDNYGKSSKGLPSTSNNSRWQNSSTKHRMSGKKHESVAHKAKHLYGLDLADITSTTTRSMDMESMLEGQSDSDGDISTTDARTIRKQLEGLENMYSEVLKLLGVKKHMGRYQPSDPRFSKRRYGSMSSLPSSSVSSRPIRDKRARAYEERKKVRDLRGINKRFQRLESHVVTLARSVAHLSSEMRTQHLMIQEMENIREEISALRTQTNLAAARMQSMPRGMSNQGDLPSMANPNRVKKLTKFFGDEPPLMRLFLKGLGYEKYANAFENERVGMVELPYLSEERLQKIGIPLGPRLRILQEAQISVCQDKTLCIV